MLTKKYIKKKKFRKIFIPILKIVFFTLRYKYIKLKLVFGVRSDRSECDFKIFPVVDLTNLEGHFFSLGLKFGHINDPDFQNDSNWEKSPKAKFIL